jgi:hypothetical protein
MDPTAGATSLAPYLPIQLAAGANQVSVLGLLDSGAAINVLPRGVGLRLGSVWEQQTTPIRLAGNLAPIEARVVVVSAIVGGLPAARLAFAWAQTDSVPVILGQTSFFLEFDVCFFRSRSTFEVRPKATAVSGLI